MLKLLTKTTPWMVASLLVATTVFGQDNASKACAPKSDSPKAAAKSCAKPDCAPKNCPAPCPQPCPPTQMCPPAPNPCCPAWPVPVLNAAYNYPARTMTRCPWDIFVDVSFIYWYASQDNMELAATTSSTTAPLTAATGIPASSVIGMDFQYKPGFKVGFGGNFDYDNWDIHAEYTWYHPKMSQSSNGPSPGELLPLWGAPLTVGNNVFSSASETWKLKMDILDVDLGRWMYVGTKLTWRPDFGMRAAWIRENMSVTMTNAFAPARGTADVVSISNRSASWGIGPKIGLSTNWGAIWGFRFFGNAEADLLYTHYNKVVYKEKHTAATHGVVSQSQSDISTVRTHFDLELGLGWGTYWDCNNWYTDVALGYEFQVFADQNMFRHFSDDVMTANSFSPNGNLYVQGLTATFRLDF